MDWTGGNKEHFNFFLKKRWIVRMIIFDTQYYDDDQWCRPQVSPIKVIFSLYPTNAQNQWWTPKQDETAQQWKRLAIFFSLQTWLGRTWLQCYSIISFKEKHFSKSVLWASLGHGYISSNQGSQFRKKGKKWLYYDIA